MFRRRRNRTGLQHLREMIWPSMGLVRLGQYYKKRMARMDGSPYTIAAGFACGAAVSFTPFIGLHLLLGAIMTWTLRGSLTAMVIGTAIVGNPTTFPFIWVGTYKLGRMILGKAPHADKVPEMFTLADLLRHPQELLWPMFLGCLPFFILTGVIAFYTMRNLVAGYQQRRRLYLEKLRK